jgi:hypothetical protein
MQRITKILFRAISPLYPLISYRTSYEHAEDPNFGGCSTTNFFYNNPASNSGYTASKSRQFITELEMAWQKSTEA